MSDGLEIYEYGGEGYKPQVRFGAWRVALANFKPAWRRGNTTYLERHMKTDEVFVLLSGTASLLIGKNMTEHPMECGRLYNVKCGVLHQLIMSEDAKVLIVENDDTGTENTEYINL